MSDWSVAPTNTSQSQYPTVSNHIQHIPFVTDDKENNHQKDEKKAESNEFCCGELSPIFFLGLLIGVLSCGLLLAVILSLWLTASTTTTTTTTETPITTTTVLLNCTSGYSRAPSGKCVNILIDFNNCGSFGYVCASNYTSCSAGVCSTAPAVQLQGGTSTFINTGIDDAMYKVNLPLSITMYNYTTSNVTVTTNGVLCLGGCATTFSNAALPSGSFPGPTAFGYWDDLYIQASTSQNIYYAVSGTAPNRITKFEFYTTNLAQNGNYYHFQIVFYENLPNIVKYVYFEATDTGLSATIGVQKSSSGPNITYSVNIANSITSNLTLTFNTNTGIVTG